MDYAHLLEESSVLLDLQGADPDAVFGALADALSAQQDELAHRRDEILAALRAREAQGSTASEGVAIPHVKLPGLGGVAAVIGVHRAGADFRALDGGKVYVFFSVVRPVENADEHLGVLRWFAGIAQHPDFVSFARQAHSAREVLDLLQELASA